MDVLVNIIFGKEEDEQEIDSWFEIITNYDAAMEILRQQSEYTDGDMEKIQDHIDVFINIVGVECITNYIHMLGSGHEILYARAS